ncbi:MAG: LamG-like jellyroll fold domain-containing protein [Flavobacteriia bacterium]|jgi:hypothetical protein
MKKCVLTALAAGLCCVATTFGQVPSYVPTSGLVGWWPFNGNANDESGNGNNGTVNGATLTTDRFGASNKAYSFNGINNFITLTGTGSINFSQGATFLAWVNSNDIRNASIVDKENGCVSYGYRLNLRSNNQIWAEQGCYGAPQSGTSTIVATNAYLTNNWVLVVGVLNQVTGTNSLYINGVLINSANVTQMISNTKEIEVGRRSYLTVTDEFMNGKIDDIGIWNRALTQQEITALYQGCAVTASIAPQSNTTFCQGGSVSLQANTGTGYTYEWYKNGVFISGASQSSYIATTSGNYTVKVIDGSCNATSSAVTVTVNTNPTVSLASIGAFTNYYATPVTLSGSPSGGTYSGSGVSGNTFNPQQAGLGATSINYSYTNASNCSGSASTSTIVYDTLGTVCTSTVTVYDTIYTTVTDTLIINTTLSLAPPNDQNTILIYPNPASDHITIDNGNYAAMAGYSIVIENNAGQQVFQSTINQAQFYLDLSTWTGNGLYFVHLIDPSGATVTVRKIVLQ